MNTRTALPKKAEGAILPNRFVTVGTTTGTVKQAVAATTVIIGSSTEVATDAGETAETFIELVPQVEYGGTVTYGAPLTSDSDGKAIVATITGQFIAGYAMSAGVVGDIGEYLHAIGKF